MLGVRSLQTAFSKLSFSSVHKDINKINSLASYLRRKTPLQANTVKDISSFSTLSSPQSATSSLVSKVNKQNAVFSPFYLTSQKTRDLTTSSTNFKSLMQMHKTGPVKKIRPNKNPLVDRPMCRGVVLKTMIKKPRKPNSANRKCVLVRLTTGKEMVAYVPGEGHNLQEHNIVMVRVGKLRDVPGVKLKCIRGKYDLSHVIKRKVK